ncbi:tRNA (mnm(5)s(2)U34)-methyltransferase [Clostridium lundense]|uniref:tRNA (mnm(5)s(2)U34)-methyltransferase n=1 Tax=Clostridium lundense TaxID=319475 RepID=UPI0004887CA3|nr:class I SAM-dependent methyltransferase [Clostridium lundense]
MKKNFFTNSMNLAKEICKIKLSRGDIVVDATAGNGNDTVFLAELVGEDGKVYSFDVQKSALEKTKEKLKEKNMKHFVQLILDGHENLDKYVKEDIQLIMFNLGYLPNGARNITTKGETTVIAVKKALQILKENGIVILVIYHGHEEGKEEKILLKEFTSSLNQKQYNVINLSFTNQINNPPELICIEKRL